MEGIQMKKKSSFKVLLLVFALVLVFCPFQAFAADDAALVTATVDSAFTSAIVPPSYQISDDPNYSEGFSQDLPQSFSQGSSEFTILDATSVSGGCSITKLSSSSVRCFGYSQCPVYDSNLGIQIKLQAYYDGSWHTLQSKYKAVGGTYVSTSQDYSVTPGYYYRTYAIHTIANGTTDTSVTSSIYVG